MELTAGRPSALTCTHHLRLQAQANGVAQPAPNPLPRVISSGGRRKRAPSQIPNAAAPSSGADSDSDGTEERRRSSKKRKAEPLVREYRTRERIKAEAQAEAQAGAEVGHGPPAAC